MKIIGITMMTAPAYRQDPWRESVHQALEIVDQLVIVYGDQSDMILIRTLPEDIKLRVIPVYLEWPQPEWSYEELPKHLNAGLRKAREFKPDWIIKFDIDYFIHEEDRSKLRETLLKQKQMRIQASTMEKLQFFKSDMAYEKGGIPICLNMDFDIWYGYDKTRYTDLCQPIIPDTWYGVNMMINGEEKFFAGIPQGQPLELTERTGIHVWNYDYTFKTEPRSKELLYHFDRSHAKFWGSGYHGRRLDEITPDSATAEYIALVAGRMNKCNKKIIYNAHPKHIQDRIKDIRTDEFGHSLWNLIEFRSGDNKWVVRK